MVTKFVQVKEGVMTLKNEMDYSDVTPADSITGSLQLITLKERDFNGTKQNFWFLKFRNESDGINYLWSFPFASGLFKSIILCLAGVENLKETQIKIVPYLKDGFSKVCLYNEEVKLDWITKDLPPIKNVQVGRNIVKDDTERMNYITSLVEQIKNKIK